MQRLQKLKSLIFCSLAAACLVGALPAYAQSADPGAASIEPNTADGKSIWQLNPNRIHYWAGNDPLINNLAMNGGDFLEALTASGDYDPATQTILRMPKGAKQIKIGQVRHSSKFAPDHYAGRWILTWEGDADFAERTRGARPLIADGPNRLVRVVREGEKSGVQLSITKIGKQGVRNIRVYREEHEDLIDRGAVWTPEFLKLVSRYKVLRTLDWGGWKHAEKVEDLTPEGELYWGGGMGVSLKAQFDLAAETGVALWLNAPPRLGAPEGFSEQLSAIGSRKQQQQRVALIGAKFDTLEASVEWDRYARHIVGLMEQSGYPRERVFYLELGNEIWNWGGGLRGFGWGTEWYWGLTKELRRRTGVKYGGKGMRGGYGYFSARLAQSFAKALDEAGRNDQQWVMVIGTHTALASQTEGALQGIRDYDSASPFRQPMSRFGVATTGYYKGGFGWRGAKNMFGAKMPRDAWRAEWLRRFREDKAALGELIGQRLLSDAPNGQNAEWIVNKSRQHAGLAAQYGAFYVGQYEGSSHDILDKQLAKEPGVKEFHHAWLESEAHAAVVRLHAARMTEEFPAAVLSNYLHYGAGGPTARKPWVEAEIWAAKPKPPEAALLELLRDPSQ